MKQTHFYSIMDQQTPRVDGKRWLLLLHRMLFAGTQQTNQILWGKQNARAAKHWWGHRILILVYYQTSPGQDAEHCEDEIEKYDLEQSPTTSDLVLTLSYLSVHALLVACPSVIGGVRTWVRKRDTLLTNLHRIHEPFTARQMVSNSVFLRV